MNHSHVLYDSDPNFKIDPISRNIANNSSKKTRLIQHDHNSERFTFEIPRYIEGHDMASCNLVEIHYTNTDANTKIVRGGVYTVDDLQVKSDDENAVVCSWLVPSNATQFVGQLQFLVRFSCVNETTGKLEYVWNTAIYSSLTVSSGIYNSDSPSDNQAPPFNFVTTVSGQILKFFVGTQAEYDELTVADKLGLYAIITDDKTLDEINAKVNEINAMVNEINAPFSAIIEGRQAVSKATVLSPTMLTPIDGKISITQAGAYFVCLKVTYNDGVIEFYTDLIGIADLNRLCYGLKESGNGESPYTEYNSAWRCLSAMGMITAGRCEIAYAYRIA